MISGRGEQALGPLFAPAIRHCVLLSASLAHLFLAARAPPRPQRSREPHARRRCRRR
jgi:hypothetical protein